MMYQSHKYYAELELSKSELKKIKSYKYYLNLLPLMNFRISNAVLVVKCFKYSSDSFNISISYITSASGPIRSLSNKQI